MNEGEADDDEASFDFGVNFALGVEKREFLLSDNDEVDDGLTFGI